MIENSTIHKQVDHTHREFALVHNNIGSVEQLIMMVKRQLLTHLGWHSTLKD